MEVIPVTKRSPYLFTHKYVTLNHPFSAIIALKLLECKSEKIEVVRLTGSDHGVQKYASEITTDKKEVGDPK